MRLIDGFGPWLGLGMAAWNLCYTDDVHVCFLAECGTAAYIIPNCVVLCVKLESDQSLSGYYASFKWFYIMTDNQRIGTGCPVPQRIG